MLHTRVLAVNTIINSICVTLASAQMAFGANLNKGSCLNNMDQTFQQARALGRAYNCKMARDIKECEALMGLGPTAKLLAAGSIGAKYGLKALDGRRIPTFTSCGSKKRRATYDTLKLLLGEIAWATEDFDVDVCFPTEELKKEHLNIATNQYREELLNQIKKQEQYIAAAKTDMSPEVHEAKKNLDAHSQTLRQQTLTEQKNLDQAYEVYREREGKLVHWFHQKFDKLYGLEHMNYLLKDGIQFDLKLWQGNLERQLGEDKEAIKAYNQLRDEYLEAKKGMIAAQTRFDTVSNEPHVVKTREGLEKAKKEFEELREKTLLEKETPKVTESQKRMALTRMDDDLQSMKARLTALDRLQESFPSTLKNSSDINHYAKTLQTIMQQRDLLVGDMNLRVSISGLAADVAGQETKEASLLLADRIRAAKGALNGVRPGNITTTAIKFVSAIAATSIITETASASSSLGENAKVALELTDKMDISTQALGKVYDAANWLTDKHCESDGIFKADPSHDCKVDYSINANNSRVFEYSREELKNLIQSNPEAWCSFIHSNWSDMLGTRSATCNKSQMRLRLVNGVELLRDFNEPEKVTIQNAPGFNKAISVKLSSRGIEESLKCPIDGGMDASQNPTAVLDFDRAELSGHETCRESLKQYQQYRAILTEATSCFKGKGLKPSTSECSTYGSCSGLQPDEKDSRSSDLGTS